MYALRLVASVELIPGAALKPELQLGPGQAPVLNAGRVLLYFLGVVLVIAALGIFFVQTGVSRWVPVSLLAAGVLLIIGLAVMSFADSAPSDHHHHREEQDQLDPDREVRRWYAEGGATCLALSAAGRLLEPLPTFGPRCYGLIAIAAQLMTVASMK